MKAVVLAAGEGLRLLPITSSRPKHLIMMGGKTILEHCLDALKLCGITEIVIITHYLSEKIRDYFGDGSELGLKIEYVEQREVLGTGNATSVAEGHIEGDFVLLYGDLLFSADAVDSLIKIFKEKRPIAVMTAVPVDKPENYGIVDMNNNVVRKIVEKPSRDLAPSNLANAGLYVFTQEIFETLKNVKRSIRGEWELTDAIELLARTGNVLAIEIARDDWFDIGRPWDLLDANAWILKKMSGRILGRVEDGAHLVGSVYVAETAKIRSGAYIEGPCFIDEGADIGPNCYIRPYTSIGKKVKVGNACEVKNSVIMNGTHVGHLSYVGDSILGENCNLAAGTITANLRLDDESVKMMVKDKLADTERRKLGVILGDNVKTGINALFMPGVKVGNGCLIGPNYMVERDLPANTMAFIRQSEIRSAKKI